LGGRCWKTQGLQTFTLPNRAKAQTRTVAGDQPEVSPRTAIFIAAEQGEATHVDLDAVGYRHLDVPNGVTALMVTPLAGTVACRRSTFDVAEHRDRRAFLRERARNRRV
jgi:hypothetical protein